jgi:hypothetical protein
MLLQPQAAQPEQEATERTGPQAVRAPIHPPALAIPAMVKTKVPIPTAMPSTSATVPIGVKTWPGGGRFWTQREEQEQAARWLPASAAPPGSDCVAGSPARARSAAWRQPLLIQLAQTRDQVSEAQILAGEIPHAHGDLEPQGYYQNQKQRAGDELLQLTMEPSHHLDTDQCQDEANPEELIASRHP